MLSKQVMLGITLILGGGVLFFALAKNEPATEVANTSTVAVDTAQVDVVKPQIQPLIADINTEEKLLAQKQQMREAYALQRQEQTVALLAEQDKARQIALEKAQAEAMGRTLTNAQEISADTAAKSELIAAPTVQARPEAIEAANQAKEKQRLEKLKKEREEQAKKEQQALEKQKLEQQKTEKQKESSMQESQAPAKAITYKVQRGDTVIGVARRYNISTAALLEANKMKRGDALLLDTNIKIPSAAQAVRLEREYQDRQAKTQQASKKSDVSQEGDRKNNQAKTQEVVKSQNSELSGKYTVQVAISPDKDKVDDLVKRYRAAGYRVTTSKTTRGLRVLVGGEKTEADAKALRSKITADARVNSSGAFIHKVQ